MSRPGVPEEGSFLWYLHQGGFVRALASAVLAAEGRDLVRLRRVFPQMVAAFESVSWLDAPVGFEPNPSAKRSCDLAPVPGELPFVKE